MAERDASFGASVVINQATSEARAAEAIAAIEQAGARAIALVRCGRRESRRRHARG